MQFAIHQVAFNDRLLVFPCIERKVVSRGCARHVHAISQRRQLTLDLAAVLRERKNRFMQLAVMQRLPCRRPTSRKALPKRRSRKQRQTK